MISRTSVHEHIGTFAESFSSGGRTFDIQGEGSVFAAYGSVFRDNYVSAASGWLEISEFARGSMADCLVTGNEAGMDTGVLRVLTGATLSVSRTTFRDNRAGYAGCFDVTGLGTLTIVESDIVGCSAVTHSGMLYLTDGSVYITRCRMIGHGAGGSGSLARLASTSSFLRIVDSTISGMNTARGEFAIAVDTAPDFAVQLDTVVVDGSFDIFSHSKVLVQNCIGLNNTAVQNASVGTCQSTTDYCLAESCANDHVGIECICDIDGVLSPFPTDCMESAVIEVLADFLINPPVPIRSAFYASFYPPNSSPHTDSGTVNAYSHVHHSKAAGRDGRDSTFKRACAPVVSES